jgi:hypothetical protein
MLLETQLGIKTPSMMDDSVDIVIRHFNLVSIDGKEVG